MGVSVEDFEKLGAFYLGRVQDPESGVPKDELLLYDSKDLTTHAVCVGMTGSGKTGLCVSLLEEAAIDGIPAIAIDPKGDLGNLMLAFPELRASDFLPWVQPADAARKGLTREQYAARTAETWKRGLADWGQDGSRIERFRNAVDVSIYTPGSSAGRPLRVLRSLAAPPAGLASDPDLQRDRVQTVVSGLLSLLGIAADPIRSREHILLSTLIDRAWRAGQGLDLGDLIGQIQSPPIDRIGVMDVESFFPQRDRLEFAMSLNGLLASPGFAAWMEGEPLDIGRLLYTDAGKPRISILSIAHLSDGERMFFVTLLLNEVIAWMRAQPGTSSLRALLYMDEVFGYFPPTANPPSKTPMLTLLKQARAYGLGIVLATQNPVDLDYKGLSNTGTWFLGRLQTERDKLRVLDGLEGAATSSGARFDRAALERTLSGLKSRVFLLNNVHDDRPELFHTRWALSYLSGPLTREQISMLSPPLASVGEASPTTVAAHAALEPAGTVQPADTAAADRPLLPPDLQERFALRTSPAPAGATLVYRPALLGRAQLHYANARAKVDEWQSAWALAQLGDSAAGSPWEQAALLDEPLALDAEPEAEIKFAALPGRAARAASYKTWAKQLSSFLYRSRPLELFRCSAFKRCSAPGEDEGSFRASLTQLAREERDLTLEKLRKRYAPKLARLEERIRRAEDRVEVEQSQLKQQKLQTAVSLGATVLGALFGRRAASVGTVGRATTTLRGAGRAARERGDVARAADRLSELKAQLGELEAEFEDKVDDLDDPVDPAALELEPLPIRPRKSDIEVAPLTLVWTPWAITPEGSAEPLY